MEKEENIWFDESEKNDSSSISNSRKVEPYLSVLELTSDDKLLLGASYFGGNCWSGSLWLFNTPEKAPTGKSIAGIEMDVGVADAKFYDDKNVIYSDYSGAVSLLSVKAAADDCPVYFTRKSCFIGQDGYVSTLDTSSSAATLITGSSNSSVFVWDVETQLSTQRYAAHRNGLSAVSIKPDENQIFVSCSADGLSLVWDIRIDKPASSIAFGAMGFSSIEWLDENFVLVGDLAGSVNLIDIRNRASTSCCDLSSTQPVRRIRVNGGKNLVAVAVDVPSLHVLTNNEGVLKSVYESTEHSGLIRGMSWSKVTGKLHSCGWDTKVIHHSVPAT